MSPALPWVVEDGLPLAVLDFVVAARAHTADRLPYHRLPPYPLEAPGWDENRWHQPARPAMRRTESLRRVPGDTAVGLLIGGEGVVLAQSGAGKTTVADATGMWLDGDTIISRGLGWPNAPSWWKLPSSWRFRCQAAQLLTLTARMAAMPIAFNGAWPWWAPGVEEPLLILSPSHTHVVRNLRSGGLKHRASWMEHDMEGEIRGNKIALEEIARDWTARIAVDDDADYVFDTLLAGGHHA